MNLQDLLQSGNNITVSITLKDLKEFANILIEQTKMQLEEDIISDKAETYLTRLQVSEMLKIDLSTLWNWNKKGYLTHYELGGKRRYKMSEVKKIITGGK